MEEEKDTTLQQIAEKALADSVVRLDVETEIPLMASRPKFDLSKIETSNGSGFFIDKHLIVTNCHVLVGATSVSMKLSNTEDTFQIERVEAFDVENDLIILKVSYVGNPLTLGDSDTIKEGDVICAAGYPGGAGDVSSGTIDNIQRSHNRICTKIGTTSGSSGCPIMNSKAAVIGVHSSGDGSHGYVVPSNTLKLLIQEAGEAIPFEIWQNLPPIRALAETKAGDKMQKDGEYKEAIAHYDFAIELKPDMVEAYRGRADAKMELGLMAEGIADQLTIHRFKSVPFQFSNFKEYFSWKWGEVLLFGLRLFVKLSKTFLGQRGLFVGQGNSKVREAKSEADQGNSAKARRLYQEAINLFTEAINLDPKVAITYNNRGWH